MCTTLVHRDLRPESVKKERLLEHLFLELPNIYLSQDMKSVLELFRQGTYFQIAEMFYLEILVIIGNLKVYQTSVNHLWYSVLSCPGILYPYYLLAHKIFTLQ
jgi:hypothetical protein